MQPQDIANISQWLQQILKDLTDTHNQLQDMRGEVKASGDELKAISSRMDQRNADIMRLVENLKTHLDIVHNDTNSVKSTVEGRISHLESQIGDLKSSIHEVRNIVR